MTPSSSATNRLQPFSISSGIRARNFASRKLLASSIPVEAQLFIQTRAISSYSSMRAGRIAGSAIKGLWKERKPPRHYRGGFSNSNQKRHPCRGYAPNILGAFPRRSGEVIAVKVHHLGPGRHEVFHKLLLRVRARIDFRKGAELGVRTEDQVNTGAGP